MLRRAAVAAGIGAVAVYGAQRSWFGENAAFTVADALAVQGLRSLGAETAHVAAVKAASMRLTPLQTSPDDPSLATRVWNIDFANAVGLAAGFDKDAEGIDGLVDMGFGFVQVGSVTPKPQAGNPKPRVFRLVEDGAVINRYGFNSCGIGPVEQRLRSRWYRYNNPTQRSHGSEQAQQAQQAQQGENVLPWGQRARRGVVGINLGKNKEQQDAAHDYCEGMRRLAPFADYVVVNVSSPNTPGLRALQGRAALSKLLQQVKATRDAAQYDPGRASPPPLLVKIAPDLTDADIEDIVAVVEDVGVDGIIVSNTTVARPDTLQAADRGEKGGLSGRPLLEPSTRVLAKVYKQTKGRVPLVGVGGVASAEDAYVKIRNGASLVQLYTAMTIQGPGVVREIKRGLPLLLKRDGFASVADAVGADVEL